MDSTSDVKDARIKELEDMLHLKHEPYLKLFGLTQQQAKLLALLMDVPVADADMIRKRVDMSTEAKVAVHRLRARLAAHDIEVKAKRFYGFWLEDNMKDKINALAEAS